MVALAEVVHDECRRLEASNDTAPREVLAQVSTQAQIQTLAQDSLLANTTGRSQNGKHILGKGKLTCKICQDKDLGDFFFLYETNPLAPLMKTLNLGRGAVGSGKPLGLKLAPGQLRLVKVKILSGGKGHASSKAPRLLRLKKRKGKEALIQAHLPAN
ncbi:hypothetical protein NDU88_005157 [Pleurodeles waltl]|uniref:Uncharacterized protein n=1 Tax=Pleurodeles waltl TaxID=8319 RepID=A0AAV7MVK7_PLEWA|nr:hypothetical protein NDU88_005157 [Pleurodeles waltl]